MSALALALLAAVTLTDLVAYTTGRQTATAYMVSAAATVALAIMAGVVGL